MKVELGGGERALYCKQKGNGINVDARPTPTTDIVHDLQELPLPFKDGEAEYVYSRFFLEHVNWQLLPAFIGDVHRILAKGGRCYFITSNLKAQAEILCREFQRVDESNLKLYMQNTVGMIFGHHNYKENSHAGSLSPELAEILFRQAGFSWVVTYPFWQWAGDMVIEAQK